MIKVFAPAKINLALHVMGQRANGYHLLDMLVGFADVGDWITLVKDHGDGDSMLRLTGPEAGALSNGPNIITQVADRFATQQLSIWLEKNLPVASGIGGGSADAAATYRGILALTGRQAGADDAANLLEIGADVPMCVTAQPARVRGIGEDILPLPNMAPLHVVLVNPRVPISTPMVFRALIQKQNSEISALPQNLDDAGVFIDWLAAQRNDLQNPALGLAPQIGAALTALKGAVLARMSGSGATCFGIYETAGDAKTAANELRNKHPDWWVTPALLNGPPKVAPVWVLHHS